MVSVLQGIRVVDCTIFQLGSVAGAALGDLGAEVIKIEPRITGDPFRGHTKWQGIYPLVLPYGLSVGFEFCNVNKKSVTVDLTKHKGKEIIYKLVNKSDVFLQNFRYGVMQKLGLDYQTLSQHNSKLIYVSGNGFGFEGPDKELPAYDYLGRARSGFMAALAPPGGNPRPGISGIADQISGHFMAYGALTALIARERFGVGQEVGVSLLGSMIALQALHMSYCLLLGSSMPEENREEVPNPLWNIYRCKDGRWIALACFQSDRYWPNLCKALGIEALAQDQKYENSEKRARYCRELISILDSVFSTKTCAEWKQILGETEIIHEEVKTLPEVAEDVQALANNYIIDFDHPILGKVKQVGFPVQLRKTPAERRSAAPQLGQHTEEVLLELGYDWDGITQLKEEEVI